MAELRIGTCSWKYDSWRGLVYSAAPRLDHLVEYSRLFDTVEIDQWFWSLFPPDKTLLPSERDVAGYASSVPDSFRFSIKAPNSVTLTHFYRKEKTAPLAANRHFLDPELMASFLKRIAPLAKKTGVIMFQFEYLNREKMKGQGEFLRRMKDFIAAIPRDLPYAVEMRNANYLTAEAFAFLRENGLGAVLVQGYYMPPVWETYERFAEWLDDPVVIRLLGPDRKEIEFKSGGVWNRIVDPRDGELNRIAAVVKDLVMKRKKRVYLNVNNHYEGSAPLTIQKLRPLIGL